MMLLIIGDDFRRKDTAFLLILPRQKKFEKEEDDAGNAGYCGCDETTNDREEEVKQATNSYSRNKNQNTSKKINPKNDKTTHGK